MKVIAETKRLVIREFSLLDLENFHILMSDKDVMRFSPFGVLDRKKSRKMLLEFLKNYKKYGFGRWALNDKKTNEFIGVCGMSIFEVDEKKEYAFGYRIKKDYWGEGFASEAGKVIKEYVFEKLELKRFVALIVEENKPSLKVAEKLGMRFLKKSIFRGFLVNVYEIGD